MNLSRVLHYQHTMTCPGAKEDSTKEENGQNDLGVAGPRFRRQGEIPIRSFKKLISRLTFTIQLRYGTCVASILYRRL